MKLDLKALKAHLGERISFAEQITLHESDFHEPITLNSPLCAEGWAVMYPDHIIDMEVHLKVELDRACSRCLAPIKADVKLEEQISLSGTQTLQLLPDSFSYVIDSPEVDLTPVFLSLLVEHFDLKPLCKSDCKGLCSSCGIDLNTSSCECGKQHDKDPRLAALAKLLDE